MNRGRILCAKYTDASIQNALYKEYTGNGEKNNLFVLDFKGELIHSAVNFQESLQD